MSYSFQAKGATKAEAVAAVVVEMDKVVAQQPIHAADKEQAVTAATAFVNLLPDDDTKNVLVSVSGWLQWEGENNITGTSFSVNASLKVREAAP